MQINWEKWIDSGGDPQWKPLRQAVHVVLLAIASCDSLKGDMMLKGGILMSLCYGSSRYTRDIDFSQKDKYQLGDEERLISDLNEALIQSVQEVDYGIDCKVQSFELKPPSKENPTFPTLKVKIGYAYNYNKRMHKRLIAGQSSTILEVDFSFNETTKKAEDFYISETQTLLRYSITDLIAEKFRALLQQEKRNRTREQDLYDLLLLIRQEKLPIAEIKSEILDALINSARSKKIELNKDSMDEGKIREMTKTDYEKLRDMVDGGEVEDFDIAYDEVNGFYRSLPWSP